MGRRRKFAPQSLTPDPLPPSAQIFNVITGYAFLVDAQGRIRWQVRARPPWPAALSFCNQYTGVRQAHGHPAAAELDTLPQLATQLLAQTRR